MQALPLPGGVCVTLRPPDYYKLFAESNRGSTRVPLLPPPLPSAACSSFGVLRELDQPAVLPLSHFGAQQLYDEACFLPAPRGSSSSGSSSSSSSSTPVITPKSELQRCGDARPCACTCSATGSSNVLAATPRRASAPSLLQTRGGLARAGAPCGRGAGGRGAGLRRRRHGHAERCAQPVRPMLRRCVCTGCKNDSCSLRRHCCSLLLLLRRPRLSTSPSLPPPPPTTPSAAPSRATASSSSST